MNTEQLIKGIEPKFDHSRIVFWHDPDQTFVDLLAELSEVLSDSDISLIDTRGASLFETKKRVELDEPSTAFLLYFAEEEPEPEEDWLLDIRLYSDGFYADASSIILSDLGISRMSLRSHISSRLPFFNNKQRVSTLKRWIVEDEDERSLDLKMMAVLAKAETSTLDDLLMRLLSEYADELDGTSKPGKSIIERLDTHGLSKSFWSEVERKFSYQSASPSITDLAMKLFCTELWSQIQGDEQQWLESHVLGSSSGRSSAQAFLVGWRDRNRYAKDHDRIASDLDQRLEIMERCASCGLDLILQCETFESIEQIIILDLVQILLDSMEGGISQIDHSQFEAVLSARRSGHWCRVKPDLYGRIYRALQAAESLLALHYQYRDGFQYSSIQMMAENYQSELYRFDQSYRLFSEEVAILKSRGSDILHHLADVVEDLYSNWYLYDLGLSWDRLLEKDQMLTNWQLSGISLQQDFYDKQVNSLLTKGRIKRLFVIISDAMRYEVAAELSDKINHEKRFKAELAAQLGVLPSYTQLGMAAMLPHEVLEIEEVAGAPLRVDGQSASGIDNRNKILSSVGGMAIKAKELQRWSSQEGRERIRDARVVYIYHNTIDAIGDKAETEEKSFEACRDAVNELGDLVRRVIDRLNGSRVILTADHGFLYRQQPMGAADKTGLSEKRPAGTYEAKKRYLLGKGLDEVENCWKGSTANTAGTSCGSEFLLPKGASRFHFVGGAKFVHGGAMPQEVLVPLISISALQKEKAETLAKKRVGVVVATQPIKIVNNIDKIRLIQSDALDDRYIARSLTIVIVDAEGRKVSSEERVVFDSHSKNMDERVREVTLKLVGADFNRNALYQLLLTDSEDNIEYHRYPLSIDLAFQDDFF